MSRQRMTSGGKNRPTGLLFLANSVNTQTNSISANYVLLWGYEFQLTTSEMLLGSSLFLAENKATYFRTRQPNLHILIMQNKVAPSDE